MEREQFERLKTVSAFIAAEAVLLYLSTWAFSPRTRDKIKDRSCGFSELSGDTSDDMLCCHFNHDKRDPNYDSPSNGVYGTRREEYILHYQNEGKNGLSIRDNRSTLVGIWEQLSEEDRKGLPRPRKLK